MASNAPSKLRPRVIALQKRGVAVILQRTEAADANGALADQKARETFSGKVRVRTRRAAKSES